jgi:hypothetical protein
VHAVITFDKFRKDPFDSRVVWRAYRQRADDTFASSPDMTPTRPKVSGGSVWCSCGQCSAGGNCWVGAGSTGATGRVAVGSAGAG